MIPVEFQFFHTAHLGQGDYHGADFQMRSWPGCFDLYLHLRRISNSVPMAIPFWVTPGM